MQELLAEARHLLGLVGPGTLAQLRAARREAVIAAGNNANRSTPHQVLCLCAINQTGW